MRQVRQVARLREMRNAHGILVGEPLPKKIRQNRITLKQIIKEPDASKYCLLSSVTK
jgi:5,10-methylene-tetrahydrofolate dehydrogenase/methenyl tetrahydrofolate cyclohydrolase